MILFIGDSLAVGTPLAAYTRERVVKRAEVGIGTRAAEGRFLHPVTGRVVVVSLGTNDWGRPADVSWGARRIKRSVRGRCLLWVQVSGVPHAHDINRRIRRLGIKMVPWRCRCVHPAPSGYRFRARRIAAAIRREC